MNTGNPVFRKRNLLYEREERDGYFTIVSKLHPETRELIINKTARSVLELCSGERDIDQVIAEFENMHRDVPRERLQFDVNQVLGIYTRLGVVEWLGENPFLNRREEAVKEGYSLSIAQEGDIFRIETFLQTNHGASESGTYFCHESALVTEGEYNRLALRQKLFSYNEEFFLLEKEQEVKGLVAVSIPYCPREQAAIMKLLYCPADYAKNLLAYAREYYPRLSIRAVTKLKICESILHPLDQGLKELLANEGFVNEASLKNELGFGEDMSIWSHAYPQSFIDEVNRQRKSASRGKEVKNG